MIFHASYTLGEAVIAERLTTLANGTLPWQFIDADKALPWVEQK